jgi:hypothetical protein
MHVMNDEVPTAIDLLILRNQRAIMRALLSSRHIDEQSLITQGKETFEFLQQHGGIERRKS